jgi:deglycase
MRRQTPGVIVVRALHGDTRGLQDRQAASRNQQPAASHALSPGNVSNHKRGVMANELQGKRVAAIVADGFEQIELLEPKGALEAAGATVDVISPQTGSVRGWNHTEWGDNVRIDRGLDDAKPADYDALLLPGGVMNPDRLRTIGSAVKFIRQMFDAGKPIAAICHGPWTMIEADIVRGVRMTSYPSIKTDLKNAGASWVDEQVVVDRGIVTSRKPDDIPAFNQKMIEEFREGQHGGAGKRENARAGAR